jgi:histidine triad (HIT) family protein
MTASPPGVQECPFCAIANGQANARVVWRSESIIAFLPDVPAVEGHTLLVPRRHVRDIWGLESPLARELADATRQVAMGVATALGTEDLNIIQSNGAAAGQSVFHLHIHVVPRLSGDRMPDLWPPDAEWSAHHLDEIATKLVEAIARTEQG